jgi:mRNA interferase MazF
MNFRRGDVVLLDYPFSDASGSKVRPALVVQADRDNARLTNTIVALITRNLHRVGREPTMLLVDVTTPEGRQTGLRANSALNCSNLFTVHETRILQSIGRFSTRLMQEVDQCLRAALGLP